MQSFIYKDKNSNRTSFYELLMLPFFAQFSSDFLFVGREQFPQRAHEPKNSEAVPRRHQETESRQASGVRWASYTPW